MRIAITVKEIKSNLWSEKTFQLISLKVSTQEWRKRKFCKVFLSILWLFIFITLTVDINIICSLDWYGFKTMRFLESYNFFTLSSRLLYIVMLFWKTHHSSPNPVSVKLIDQWQSELVYYLLVSCKTKEKRENLKTPSFPLKKINKS